MGLFKPKLRKDIQEKLDSTNPIVFISVQHTAGLPVKEGTLSQVYCYSEKIDIDADNTTFVIKTSQIHDVSIKTEVDIQKQLVSSTGGAIAGAMAFGAVGALIGGRVKEKTHRDVKQYLIITFTSDNGEVKYIGFDVTFTPKAMDIVKYFETNKAASKIVKL